MNKDSIKEIFKNYKIEIKELNKANNSFSSDVYIVSTNEDKYVFKSSINKEKIENEKKYYNHLYNFLPTSKVLYSGKYNNYYYNIITYFEGNNRFDDEGNNFSRNDLRKLGMLLAKLHNCKLLDQNDSWITYINKSINLSINSINKVISNDSQMIISFMKKYLEKNIINNYENCIIHTDFRIGNTIFGNNQVGLIDMESVKCGDYIFDFVKLSRILNKKNFKIFLNGYKNKRSIDDYFYDRLEFYRLFDSIISIEWCNKNNQINTNYYNNNLKYLLEYVEVIKNGKWNI
ncbi:MAG: aminoglycoside phosphotransferase family protein [Bacilli bacterium]|nr:aminoglycoside phosphotransferase family protein [Bacilli bacterium]